ncbi:major facilitator superfamily domain-containing protein [Penicillium citrinum]|uniref:Major facilitator superfamily domain-containing protein n=1 Tax=Penicillium citrinum TaxID=5077 RepID=A0A9W9THL4_PENCI|nr:major facilitator superfamily domain-containing protein [Penicillium citrinum]KAJ5222978.1 major facilitator superfamily domain-containing protein [Penicillium citrinum]
MGTPKEISARQDEQIDTEKKAGINQAVEETNDDLVSEEKNSENFQNGVQRVKAITSVWSTKTMVLMFIPLYLDSFVDAFIVSIQTVLDLYNTSSLIKTQFESSTGALFAYVYSII